MKNNTAITRLRGGTLRNFVARPSGLLTSAYSTSLSLCPNSSLRSELRIRPGRYMKLPQSE